MKTYKRRSKPSPFRDDPEPKPPEPEPVPPAPIDTKDTKPVDTKSRIYITIKEDGAIDLDTMRESTKQKLRDTLRATPEFFPSSAAQVQIFHPAMVSGMYDLMGALESMLAQKAFNIPEPVAKQIFSYTPAEKEALAGPTVRVLNKYAAEWMIKYQDEIALATLLGSITVAKINSAMLAAKMYRANTAGRASQEKSTENSEKNEEDVKPQAPN